MNMRVRILSAVCALLCVAGPLLLTKCADKSTDPPPDSPKDYVIYGYNFHSTRNLVGYHLQTGVIDSLSPTMEAYNLKVSPDGRKLYVAREDRVSVVDVASRETILDLPYASVSQILFSPDGRAMALFPGGLTLLRVSDYTVLYHHTAFTGPGAFSNNGKFYSVQNSDTLRTLSCINVGNGTVVWTRNMSLWFGWLSLVTKDDAKLIGYGEGWLRVYDIAADSMIFNRRLAYSDGDMVASPDGSRLFLTGMGNIDIGPAPFTFAVYDIPGNKMLDSVRVPYPGNGWCPESDYIAAGFMTITPDGYLIAQNARGGMLLVYNLVRSDTAKWLCTRLGMSYLTCQTNP